MNQIKKQAVSQQKDNSLSVQTVIIGKKQASFLVPDLSDDQKLAVIDEEVLEFLKSLLPTANDYEIINNFITKMERIRNTPCTLEAAVAAAKHFVTFHESVNLMEKYFDPKVTVVMEEPFNVVKPEKTIDEKIAELEKLEANIVGTLGTSVSEYKWNKRQETIIEEGPQVVGPTKC